MKKLFSLLFLLIFFVSCSSVENIKYVKRDTNEIKIEKVSGENWLKFLYYNPFGKLTLETLVKRKFLTDIYGKYMSSKFSKNKIEKFVKEFEINMDESLKKIEDFKSFNDFFYRKLKKEARKIDFSENIIISPADGKILVFDKISKINDLFIKGKKFEIKDFLKDEKLVKEYENGSMAIIRLAPQNYHRLHFPYDGYISKSKLINGYYYSVSPHAIRNNINVFLENKREMSILNTKLFDKIILVEVGATMVGGIQQTYIPETYVKKGDEKSYFYFGGSTIIMLFKNNTIKFDEDLIKNTNNKLETEIYFGERIGKSYF